jgi:hypothetical protein
MALGGEGDAAHAFLQTALAIPYKLSTSQIPQRQTDFKVRVGHFHFAPSFLSFGSPAVSRACDGRFSSLLSD